MYIDFSNILGVKNYEIIFSILHTLGYAKSTGRKRPFQNLEIDNNIYPHILNPFQYKMVYRFLISIFSISSIFS